MVDWVQGWKVKTWAKKQKAQDLMEAQQKALEEREKNEESSTEDRSKASGKSKKN